MKLKTCINECAFNSTYYQIYKEFHNCKKTQKQIDQRTSFKQGSASVAHMPQIQTRLCAKF